MSCQRQEQCWKKDSWRKRGQRQSCRNEKRCMQLYSTQPVFTVKSTSPDTENHYKNGYISTVESRNTTENWKAPRGFWDDSKKTDGRGGCGVDRDKWISKIAVPLKASTAMAAEEVSASVLIGILDLVLMGRRERRGKSNWRTFWSLLVDLFQSSSFSQIHSINDAVKKTWDVLCGLTRGYNNVLRNFKRTKLCGSCRSRWRGTRQTLRDRLKWRDDGKKKDGTWRKRRTKRTRQENERWKRREDAAKVGVSGGGARRR